VEITTAENDRGCRWKKGTLVKQLEKDLGMAKSATPEQVQWRELLEIQRLQADLADARLAIQELEEL
jgi:hypothetical protein